MSVKQILIVFSVFLLSLSAKASVISGDVNITGNNVTLSTGRVDQTEASQVFTFLFDDIPLSDGLDGSLIVGARGDYSLGFETTENIGIQIDGFSVGNFGATTDSLIQKFNSDYTEWQTSDQLNGLFLTTVPFGWTADGKIELVVSLNSSVDLDLVNGGNAPYFEVIVNYTTAVPIPMGIVLFTTALFSLVSVRRRPLSLV